MARRNSNVTVSEYADELERRLRRAGLTPSRARSAADEVRAHADERAAALEEMGASREEAAAGAIAGFGPARRLARSLADSAYEGPYTVAARRAETVVLGFAAVAPALCVLFLLSGETWTDTWYGLVYAWLGAGLAGVPLLAFQGRRPRPLRVLAGGCAVLAATGLVFGAAVAPPVTDSGMAVVRWNAPEGIAAYDAALTTAARERALLDEGVAFWSSPAAAAGDVPLSLRAAGGGYVVPRSLPRATRPVSAEVMSAFINVKRDARWREVVRRQEPPVPAFHRIAATSGPESVATPEEARRRWATDGATWREWRRRDEAELRERRDGMAAALRRPVWEGVGRGLDMAAQTALPLPAVVLAHWLGASLGRAVVRRRWRREEAVGGHGDCAARTA
jgi:hypothetical protein